MHGGRLCGEERMKMSMGMGKRVPGSDEHDCAEHFGIEDEERRKKSPGRVEGLIYLRTGWQPSQAKASMLFVWGRSRRQEARGRRQEGGALEQ